VIPIQPITIVSSGGTPMQLCDQKGAPYPTTGFGALVFNTGPTLIDAILLNPLITFDVIKLPGGDFYNPSLQFTADNSKTPGLYSTGPGNISLVGTNGDESSRALLASFDHPGNLHVANLLNIGGTIPPADSSTLAATTKWVNDQGYLTGTGAAGLYLPLVGGTLTGPLTGTTATFSSNVGVGGAPAARLHVQDNVNSNEFLYFQNVSTGATAATIFRQDTGGRRVDRVVNYTGQYLLENAVAIPTRYSDFDTHNFRNSAGTLGVSISSTGALTGTTATFSGGGFFAGNVFARNTTAVPAGGVGAGGVYLSTTSNFGITFGSGVPTASQARGTLYLRSDGGGPYVNTDGATTWAVMGGGGGGASLTISDTPPGSPTAGAMWWNSVLGTLMVYYNDGNSSQWVPATPTMAGSYLPLAGGTLTGPLTGTSALFNGDINTSGAAGTNRTLKLQTAGTTRWGIRATADPETGGNAGSNFFFYSQADGGAVLGTPITIDRASGTMALNLQTTPMITIGPTAAVQVSAPLTGTNATFSENNSTQNTFAVSNPGANGVAIKLTGDGATTPSKFIRVNGGNFQIINSGYSAVPFSMSDAGNLAISGGFTAVGTVIAPGAQIQMVSVETGAPATGTTIMPDDNTIPQISEGTQFMTLAITPKLATSNLIITVNAILSCNTSGYDVSAALFRDAVAAALAASVAFIPTANTYQALTFTHTMTSGGTSPITFRLRAGPSAAASVSFNGLFGGVAASSIVIREVAP
jgi:hypothetical protein